MNRDERIVKLKLDVIFKRVFGNENNTNIISAFVSALLEIPRESIKKIYINNVELTPEYLEQKFSRLDLKLDVDGRIVNVEMQVNSEPDFKERTLFYWSRLYSEELRSGDEYADLRQTICINIINFNLFDTPEYHSFFRVMENERHEILTDKLAIHFFELRKIGNCRKNKPMEDWLDLINAETEEELMELQRSTTIPEIHETIVMLRELSADEKIRQEAYYREKRLHDEASALGHARREGIAEGMVKGKAEGIAEGIAEGMAKGKAEGIAEGMVKGKAEGKAEFAAEITERLQAMGFSEEQIKKALEG